jgi:DNA-binding NtrC family response regulator
MTSDMAFECLLVSKDASVVTTMQKMLEDLAISTNVCATPAKAFDYLSEGVTDLVILDWQKDSPALLQHIGRSLLRKPTVMVVSDTANPMPGAYSFLRKPITANSGAQSLKQAYSKLLEDYRQCARFGLVGLVTAKNQYGRSVPITLTNISAGGVGFSTEEILLRGDILSFGIPLPGTDITIEVEARVLWMRQYGAAGCEFANIAHADRCVLQAWLEQKCQVKKPLVEI